ncbi:ABC transporter substrate-binding protein [Gordonia sp. ABSL1-1]|uniref:ABC transporter substrate-binding protein n=1 Tax=Gordonia sp. ABSL1-1 TaxID=3053923 RepID=UPI0025731947|nr:ABC transporter substrate-binding protein [Gordonia sp. ABSL1-1]MDL9938079.1 ABC transporter substrate-binding protein [Gordonia sp. ABSL1-1]
MRIPNSAVTARVFAAAAAAAMLVTMTACSSDDESTESADTSVALPADAFPGTAATGTPIKIGLINNEDGQAVSQPENREAAEAAATYANENLGGIAGHRIELVTCKQQEDPTSAGNCARQMVENKVAAVVVTSTGQSQVMTPIITGAGIPYVTSVGGGIADLTGDNSFVWTSGASSSLAMATHAKNNGYKSVVAYSIENPAAIGALETIAKPAFNAVGIDLKIVPIPFGQADATPQVTAGLKDKPEGVIVFGESTVCTSVLKSLNTLGSTAQVMTPQPCAAPEVVESVGTAGVEGMLVFSNADTVSDDPESVLFRAVMQKYAPNTSTAGYAVTGYQGMLGLVRATAGLTGEATPAAVSKAISTAVAVKLPAGDGITFTCNGKAVTGMKAVCSNTLIALTMKDGKLTNPQKVTLLGS